MRILLARPPSSIGRIGAHALQHPIGLCWLAAVARQGGHEPRIYDAEVDDRGIEGFEHLVEEFRPEVIGFTAMTPTVGEAARMAAAARRTAAKAKNFIGGAHAASLPVETLEAYPDFDAAVTGDGEPKFAELLKQVETGTWGESPVPGAALRAGGEILDFTGMAAVAANLDELPLPARDLLPLDLYHGAPTPGFPQDVYRATVLFASRGCPGKCIFCCAGLVFGPHVRYRSVPNILHEINECRERYGFRHFTIDDDTFTLRRDLVMEFCEAVGPLGVTWDCDTRVDRIDEELVSAMYRAGCRKLAFGVESGSAEILRAIGKGITPEQVVEAFRVTRGAGIQTCGFFMVGSHPDETAEHIRATKNLIRKIDPDYISVAIASPYPRTRLHEILKSKGLMPDVGWEDYGQSFLGKPFTRTRTLGPGDLLRAQGMLLRAHYLRPVYILRRLSRLRNFSEARYWFSAGVQFLRYLRARRGVGTK